MCKVRALVAAWCRHDWQLSEALLSNASEFGVVEVLKAAQIMDSARKARQLERKMAQLIKAKETAGHKGKSRLGRKTVALRVNINNLKVCKNDSVMRRSNVSFVARRTAQRHINSTIATPHRQVDAHDRRGAVAVLRTSPADEHLATASRCGALERGEGLCTRLVPQVLLQRERCAQRCTRASMRWHHCWQRQRICRRNECAVSVSEGVA